MREMGYKIKLKEKSLYSWGLMEDEEEELSDADVQSMSEGDAATTPKARPAPSAQSSTVQLVKR